MKSRAAVLRGVGVDWEVTDIELDPPRAGEVLVKMAFAGICHSDEHFYTGEMCAGPACVSVTMATTQTPMAAATSTTRSTSPMGESD